MHRRNVLSALFAIPLLVATAGCAAVGAALPHIIAAVVDGVQVLDTIYAFVQQFFAKHPDADTQAKVEAALQKCRAALNVALRTAEGADGVANAQTDAAFEAFKQAYLELIALVRPLGVNTGDRLSAASAGDTLVVPEPLALTKHLKGGSK